MITRLSKIARLPATIRDQLNRRLHDGQLSNTILPWVNSLPETQEILAELFNNKPITHQNLSEWRRAGYQDWLFHQQRLDWFAHLTEQSSDIEKHDGSPDTFETMANIFLFEIAQAIHVMKATQDPNQRCDRLQNLIREFARLQNAYNFSRRIELDYVKHNGTRADSGTGVSPVSPNLGPPPPASKSDESDTPGSPPIQSHRTRKMPALPTAGGASVLTSRTPHETAACETREEYPTAGGASVLASRAPHETTVPEVIDVAESNPTPERQSPAALPAAPRNPDAPTERASVPDCGSPLPLSEDREPNSSTPKLLNSQTPPAAPRLSDAPAERASVPDCGSPLPLSEDREPNSSTPKLLNSQTPPAAPRDPAAPTERASVLDCGSPLPLSARIPHPTPKLVNSNSGPGASPFHPLAPTPATPPVPPRPYKPHANPIRGRRFTCIEG